MIWILLTLKIYQNHMQIFVFLSPFFDKGSINRYSNNEHFLHSHSIFGHNIYSQNFYFLYMYLIEWYNLNKCISFTESFLYKKVINLDALTIIKLIQNREKNLKMSKEVFFHPMYIVDAYYKYLYTCNKKIWY